MISPKNCGIWVTYHESKRQSTSVIYVVAERKLICNSSKDNTILDAVNDLCPLYSTYNLNDEAQRKAKVFFQTILEFWLAKVFLGANNSGFSAKILDICIAFKSAPASLDLNSNICNVISFRFNC
jgi:hypothetical protein